MKNRLIITVSDLSGTKSYSVHRLVKMIVLILIFTSLLLIGASFWIVAYQSKKFSELKKSKEIEINSLVLKENELIEENKLHELRIKDKLLGIEVLSSKLDNLEVIMGITNGEIKTPMERTKIIEITTQDRQKMLKVIPNGLPLTKTLVISNFGNRIHPISKRKKFHRGIDLRAKYNTKVFSTANGVVKKVQPSNIGDFGRLVIVSHNFGFETVYAHLNKTIVKLGDIVKKGQVIGLSGSSGRSTGPHLHYEVRHASLVLNPYPFMKWNIKTYESIFEKERRVQWQSLVEMISQTKIITAQQ